MSGLKAASGLLVVVASVLGVQAPGALAAVAHSPAFDAYEALPLPIGRPCEAADLPGVWASTQMPVSDAPMGLPQATDYIAIESDGRMNYFGTRGPSLSLPEVRDRLATADRLDGVTYLVSLPSSGVLLISREANVGEGFTCTVVSRTEVLWSQLQGRSPVLRRHIRMDR